LLVALVHHDERWCDYLDAQRLAIQRFLPRNAQVRQTYSELLATLMQQPPT